MFLIKIILKKLIYFFNDLTTTKQTKSIFKGLTKYNFKEAIKVIAGPLDYTYQITKFIYI